MRLHAGEGTESGIAGHTFEWPLGGNRKLINHHDQWGLYAVTWSVLAYNGHYKGLLLFMSASLYTPSALQARLDLSHLLIFESVSA